MKKLISFVTGVVFILSAVTPAALAAGGDADGKAEQVTEVQEVEAADPEALTLEETEDAVQLFADVAEGDNNGETEEKESPLLKKLDTKGLKIIESGHSSNILGPEKAFDGLLGEVAAGVTGRDYWNFFEASGNPQYVGLDLGADMPGYVKKIRYLPRFNFGERMNGAVFEGSNTAEKIGYEAITDPLQGHSKGSTSDFNLVGPNGWFEIDLTNNLKAYRYLRLRKEKELNVAEIEFYMAAGANLEATKIAAQIDTLIVNNGSVALPLLGNANYELSYSIAAGSDVASLNGNSIVYNASVERDVDVQIDVTVTNKSDEEDRITIPVNVKVERARTDEERVADDKLLTEALDITVYSEDDKEIIYLLPKKSKFQSTLKWGFKEDNNTYGDTITDFNSEYYKLTVDPSSNKYLSRTVEITAIITYGAESDTVNRTVSVNPQVTKNVGGHTFHYKQIEGQISDKTKGGVKITDGQILLSGYGDDIGNAPDTLAYFYKKTDAENLSISVKIDQTSPGTNRYRRFGLMFRSSDDPSARMVLLAISPDGGGEGLQFSSRKGSGYSQTRAYRDLTIRGGRTYGVLKLEKKGSRFKAYYSTDEGETFEELIDKGNNTNLVINPDVNMAFDGEYLVGLVTASNNAEPTYFSRLAIDDEDVFVSNDIRDVKFSSGNKKINVAWSDPTEQDIRTFDKIAVTCTDGKEFTEVKEVEKGVQAVAFDNLENGTEYTVSVQAKTAKIRKNAVPAEVKAYNAYSVPITKKVIPFDINELQTNKPQIKVSAPAAKVGQKSDVSLKFENPMPVCSMSLNVKASDDLMITLNDIKLSESLKAAGAIVEKTADGFKISYSAKDGKVINISDIANFGAGSLTAGSKTVSVSGALVFYTQEAGEVSVSLSENSNASITFTQGSGGGSGSSGGGVGGAGYGVGTKREDPKPIYTPGEGNNNNPSSDSIFTDEREIPEWAKTPVAELVKRGIISGSPSEGGYAFNPSGKVTREQFIKMCVTAFSQVDNSANCEFTDVSSTEWYYPYVATAAKLGITSGMGDGRFGIDEPITRQDMAVFLYRMVTSGYAELTDKAEEIEFADSTEVEDYAKEAVRTMQKAGIINGYEDGRFAPNDAATRDMAAKMIYNILVGGAE